MKNDQFTLYKLIFAITSLYITSNVSAQQFEHCNSILNHGISNITIHKSANHTRAYKWHSNCGMNYSNASDSSISTASGSMFGYGSASGGHSRSEQIEKINSWCKENEKFALANHNLYEEARIISESATSAWNQCQDVAKKGVNISYKPMGPNYETVHFSIDSTLDSDLVFYGITEENYSCKILDRNENSPVTGAQPLIKNANIHINCNRNKPLTLERDGIGKITYEFGSLSINTGGPALAVSFPEVVSEYIVTPPQSVMAFNATSCPVGWTEYKLAYGRFIRGIDKSERKIDPDGERKPGNLQEDMLKKHTHRHKAPRPYGAGSGGHDRAKSDSSAESEATGGVETRPKNAALLYCEKD